MDDMEFGVVDQRTYLSIHQNEIQVSGWCYLGSQGLQFLYIDEPVVMCSSSDIFWHPKSIIPVEYCIINSLRPSDAYMRR